MGLEEMLRRGLIGVLFRIALSAIRQLGPTDQAVQPVWALLYAAAELSRAESAEESEWSPGRPNEEAATGDVHTSYSRQTAWPEESWTFRLASLLEPSDLTKPLPCRLLPHVTAVADELDFTIELPGGVRFDLSAREPCRVRIADTELDAEMPLGLTR